LKIEREENLLHEPFQLAMKQIPQTWNLFVLSFQRALFSDFQAESNKMRSQFGAFQPQKSAGSIDTDKS
jgi:hypothetical protein